MNKIFIWPLIAAVCFLGAGCGEDPSPVAPDQLQTPQYSVVESLGLLPAPDISEIHTSVDGVKVIGGEARQEADQSASHFPFALSAYTPETVWENDAVVTYNAFTMPEMVAFDNGSIGILTIGKIGLSVNIYESDDQMEVMNRGAAHFKSTSAWDGNVGLSAHTQTASGSGAFFKDLHLLAAGDSIVYKTSLGEREYIVTTIKTISDEDWSDLSRTPENKLTLITCVNSDKAKRLVVQAVQR
jgi:LPXTG-site transpeptidase (sortase) family protein